ncbi:MAG: transcription antitermination factor NusB [Acidimicrobiales bacterium]
MSTSPEPDPGTGPEQSLVPRQEQSFDPDAGLFSRELDQEPRPPEGALTPGGETGESVTTSGSGERARAPERDGRRTGERRRSRERALEIAYEAEAKCLLPAQLLGELAVAPEPYAGRLVRGMDEHRDEIDSLISRHAAGWAIARMPVIDRSLLRLAAYELLAEPEVPVAVVIDEAVELANRYSTEDSGRYVNGVLASIACDVRPS